MGNFFGKLSSWLEGKPQEAPGKEAEQKSEPISAENNIIAIRGRICNEAVKKLDVRYKGEKESFKDMVITLWVQDGIIYDGLNTDEFKNQFKVQLLHNGYKYNLLEISCEHLPEAHHFTMLDTNVFMQLEQVRAHELSSSLRIFVEGGQGALMEDEYVLAAKALLNRRPSAYNIGRGKQVGYRTNHIAVDENPASPQADNNKYVSRAHAHIGYNAKDGFFLQVDEGGSVDHGNRTRVIRGEDIIDLRTVGQAFPLQDEDLIELGKHVILRVLFEE
ncbi:MAG: hypothetical protein J5642_06490 [Bacteroidales bacterium]|nr:hypothetical protein [Bacteroidales bacterium]